MAGPSQWFQRACSRRQRVKHCRVAHCAKHCALTPVLTCVVSGERPVYQQVAVVDMNELAEDSRMGGEAAGGAGWSRRVAGWVRQLVGGAVPKPHAERRTRRALAPHNTLDGNGIKAGTFERGYRVAGFRQAADVLPVHPELTGECLKAAGYQVVAGGARRSSISSIAIAGKT
jgi:(2Fe-2S) ferredoxin